VLQVGFHLGTLETVAALGLGLIIVALIATFSQLAGALGLVLGNALLLRLLVGSSFSLSFRFGLLGLLGLLAFGIRVIGGVP
jgi:hypothetical protein